MSLLLEARGVTAGYGPVPVIRDMTIEVATGACVGIIGPNGHGKSTFLKALTRLLPLRSGELWFAGEDLTGCPAHMVARAGLGYVPQGDLLFPDMSVGDNLLAAAAARDWSGRDARLADVFALFPRLEERQRQLAGTLSGGERRMLAIGRTLMARVELLVLDEPSLGLSPKVVAEMYEAIGRMREAGTSLLIVEEKPERLVGLADHTYLIESGAVVRSGSLSEVLADDQLVRTYFGVDLGAAEAHA